MKKANCLNCIPIIQLLKIMRKIVALAFIMIPMLWAAPNLELAKQKTAACAACHGAAGISTNPEWPSLAGQHVRYLIKQLRDYKKGTRVSAIMAPMVSSLSEEDIANIAAFYASQPLPEGKTLKKYMKRGEQIYRGGDFHKHITACIACHNPNGKGNDQAGFPALSGQQIVYTQKTLQDFKDRKRTNDLNSIMHDISARMSAEDMEAVANYVHGLY